MNRFGTLIFISISLLLVGCGPSGKETTAPDVAAPKSPTPAAQSTPTILPTDIPTAAIPIASPTTPAAEEEHQPPAGGLIAFASDLDGDFEIWLMNADGSNQRKLTANDADDWSPAWSPDGSQIAFVSNRDGSDEIYVMNADGSAATRLTQTPDASESFPAWSPDGSAISFDSDRDGNWEVYSMQSDGGNPLRLTNNSANDWISSWSPDGSLITFESNRDGNYEIYTMASDGAEQEQLTYNQSHAGFPAWSPDGSQIAFMSQQSGNYDIYVINADGTEQKRVTQDPAQDSDPGWSPDGEWITFVSHRSGSDEIYIIGTDGSSLRQLTSNGAQNWSPSWQPTFQQSTTINTWISVFEGPDYGAFFDALLTEDGSVLVVGATNHLHVPPYSGDALIMKLTLDGAVIWEKTWGADGYEQAFSAVPADDGGYYVFGETDSFGAGDRDFFVLKLAEDGTQDWFQTYGKSRREWPFGMLRLSNGDLLLHGFTTPDESGGRDQYVLRVESDGGTLWEYIAESPEEELVLDVTETPQGDLVLAVSTDEDGKLVKLDPDGNILWTNRFELEGWQFPSQIIQTENGGFLLAGFSMSPDQQADIWLARSTAVGMLEWETTFGDPEYDDYAQSLIRLQDGDFLIGGIGNGALLSRIDEDGTVIWRRSLLDQSVYGSQALIELKDGGYLVSGFKQVVPARSYDAFILRTDSEGRFEQ